MIFQSKRSTASKERDRMKCEIEITNNYRFGTGNDMRCELKQHPELRRKSWR